MSGRDVLKLANNGGESGLATGKNSASSLSTAVSCSAAGETKAFSSLSLSLFHVARAVWLLGPISHESAKPHFGNGYLNITKM